MATLDKPNFNNPVIDDSRIPDPATGKTKLRNIFTGQWQRWIANLFETLQVVDGGTP